MMRSLVQWTMAALLFAIGSPAFADLNVFATVPEWGALAQELGGDKVKVYVATNALQDPHHVEAKPSLIARARSADLVVATGAELEIGWLPLVLQQAGNPKVQPGKPGYFEAAPFVTMLDKPDAPRSRGGRRARGRRSAYPDRSAQYRARRGAARGQARASSIRRTPRITRRATRLSPTAGPRRSRVGRRKLRRSKAFRCSSSTRRSPI